MITTRDSGTRRRPNPAGLRRPDLVVLDVDGHLTSAWSPAGRMGPEPSVSALDRSGRCRAHGLLAVDWASQPRRGLRLERPFVPTGIHRPELAALHVVWALARCGRPRFRDTVVLPVRDSDGLSGRPSLPDVIDAVGAAPLLVSRTMAAAVGLGLDVDGERAHMLVEVTEALAEIAVVADGSVLCSLAVERSADLIGDLAAGVRRVLGAIDPDLELDIRDSAIHLHGKSDAGMATLLARELRVRVVTAGAASPVLDGARRIGAEAHPRLTRI